LNVSMDPRMIQQLLSYQWINPAGILGGDDQTVQQDGSLFALLLSGLLSDTASPSVTAAGLPAAAIVPEASMLSGYASFAAQGWPYSAWPSYWPGSALAGISLLGRTLNPASEADPLNPGAGTKAADAYDAFISAAAAQYGVHQALIKGVIQAESGFDADAVSPAGAKGLMQLMDDTARMLGVRNPWDPAQNIDAGTRYLSYLLRKYDGHLYPALAAYNAGPGRVDRLGLTTDDEVLARFAELPEETRNYIPKVLQFARYWGFNF